MKAIPLYEVYGSSRLDFLPSIKVLSQIRLILSVVLCGTYVVNLLSFYL